MPTGATTDSAELRRRAEARLDGGAAPTADAPGALRSERLIHELQVHRIELELQNEELRASQERLEAVSAELANLYDFAPVGYFSLDQSGVISRCNLAGAGLLGLERARLANLRLASFVAEEDLPAFSAVLAALLAGDAEQSCEVRIEGQGCAPRIVRLNGTVAPDGLGCRVVAADITERRHAEQSLRERELQLSGIVDSAMDAIVSVDEAERIVVFNVAAAAMFRCPPADAIGQSIERFIPRRFRAGHATHLREFGTSGATSRPMGRPGVVQGLRANGEEFPVEASISHVEVMGRKIYSVILRDVSVRVAADAAQRNMQVQLRETQKMELLGMLAGGMGHDLGNIVGAILNNAAQARDQVGEQHPAHARLGEITEAGERARSMIEQVLAFGGGRNQDLVNQPLQPLLAETIKQLRSSMPAAVRFDLVMPSSPVHACVDAMQFSQVLVNLCTNAWRSLKDVSGRIGLELEEVRFEVESSKTNAMPPGRYARIRVRDGGKQVDEAAQAWVFEPFFTTRPVGVGTGLGLSVVRGIVQAHRGGIALSSAPGEGSVFDIFLPVAEVPA